MKKNVSILGLFCLFLLQVLTGCQGSGNINRTHTVTAKISQDLAIRNTTTPTITPTRELVHTIAATDTPFPSATPKHPCSPEQCTYPGHFFLDRPILPTANNEIDPTYRYGNTQEGTRPTHHGVEFVNDEGTPVLAAAEGFVIVAGDDFQQAYADYPYYYGNLVIIEHAFTGIKDPVFTLYAHLSAVKVQAGDHIQAGDQVGAVGYTGVAEWSHLHFEVRQGDNLFRNTRNPELWLKPHLNESGEINGAMAGQIIDEFGNPIYFPAVVVEQLSSEGEVLQTIYVETYADFTVNGDDAWDENFVISDLSPGTYRVSFVARGLQVKEVEVYPGQVTLFVFDASQV